MKELLEYVIRNNAYEVERIFNQLNQNKAKKVSNSLARGVPLLSVASKFGNVEVAMVLIDNGADVNFPKSRVRNGETPLSVAAKNNHLEMARMLVERGAKYHQEIAGQNDSFYVLRYCTIDVAREILSYIAVKNSEFKFEGERTKEDDFLALVNAIDVNDKLEVSRALETSCLNNNELETILIFAVRNLRFRAAREILSNENGALSANKKEQEEHCFDEDNSGFRQYVQKTLENELDFSSSSYHDLASQERVKNGFCAIADLFSDTARCRGYLAELSQQLGSLLEFPNQEGKVEEMVIRGLKWPRFLSSDYQLIDKNSALTKIIKNQLKKHGIEDADNELKFSGFVDSKYADDEVKSGRLFKEFFLSGIALVHGVMTHYLQWYLISRDYEEGRLQSELTPRELLEASVTTRISKTNSPVWNVLVDYPIDSTREVDYDSFGKVIKFNSFLLCNEDPELMDLSNYLRDSFFKNSNKVAKALKQKYPEVELREQNFEIANIMVASLAATGEVFNMINFFDLEDTKQYYEEKNESRNVVVGDNAIVRKGTLTPVSGEGILQASKLNVASL